jgi:hypothetical protein
MIEDTPRVGLSFFARVGLAFRIAFDGLLAKRVAAAISAEPQQNKPETKPSAPDYTSGLFVLSALQREGRLIDFLEQDIASFSDEEVGAAARVVHEGCRKVTRQYFAFEPAMQEGEGASVTLPAGFDSQKVRLTGNITGQPPFRGTLKHHGWVAKEVKLPALSTAIDVKVIAPAEVELP